MIGTVALARGNGFPATGSAIADAANEDALHGVLFPFPGLDRRDREQLPERFQTRLGFAALPSAVLLRRDARFCKECMDGKPRRFRMPPDKS